MKLFKTLSIVGLMILPSCKLLRGATRFPIDGYTYSYITSEVQEYTHDVRLAKVPSIGAYIAVPEEYSDPEYVYAKQTGKVVYYWIEEVEDKVSNQGWEYFE